MATPDTPSARPAGRTRIERVMDAVQRETWMLQPEKLEVLGQILADKAASGRIPEASEVAAAEARQAKSVQTGGSIAVIPLFGTISRRMGMLEAMSGGASLERFKASFRDALNSEDVSSILLQVHSPGGSVYGVEDAFRMIRQGSERKRVVAVADSLMASAAYYLGSAAGELVVEPGGEVGSIGVYTIHFDWSEAVGAEGIKVTIIKGGENKAEGNPYEPLSEDSRAHIQGIVDRYYNQFVEAVAKGRGVSVETVEERFGQGRTFHAEDALERGMVNRIATMDEVVDELRSGQKSRSRRAAVHVPAGLAAEIAADGSLNVPGRIEVSGDAGPPVDLEAFARRAADLVASTLAGTTEPVAEPSSNTPNPEATPTAARGHAAPDSTPDAPTEPAPAATEESMSDQDKGPQTNGADQQKAIAEAKEAARSEERARVRQIREIADTHNVDAETTKRWIDDGNTVDEVNAAALRVIQARADAAPATPRPNVAVVEDREANKPFGSLGEQLHAVVVAGRAGAVPDKRLLHLNAAASGSGEAIPSDGGFLLQPEFTSEILKRTYETGQVASRVRRRPIGPNANGLKLKAIDETSRVTGSRYGGIRMYWADEADTVTASKPKFRTIELSLKKLMGLWYVTDELLEDAVALQAFGEDAFTEETSFMIENAIFRGTGAGQPLGFLNSSALVSVAAEGGQSADTIVAANVVKMRARLWARSLMNAVWFINQDAEPQLPLMTIGDQPVYLPPGGLRDQPFGTLLGRPVIPVEYCATVGNVGDIVLTDLDQYVLIDKGQVDKAWSIHVRFIYDEQTFRITYRVDAQPIWNAPLTPFQGSNTQSPFVALAARD